MHTLIRCNGAPSPFVLLFFLCGYALRLVLSITPFTMKFHRGYLLVVTRDFQGITAIQKHSARYGTGVSLTARNSAFYARTEPSSTSSHGYVTGGST
ncbi:unnamed protein product [Acanthoscelides obtectus]|uniref:Uncharacterized protein n=1 Tax=Acanthoscelides obtectus TaxID=200917 RepID=A0A9P0M110_ACAOB|nr:unnamed protein product [Acanthoscelides obtectus]CAK1658601.1 hypothetical protein AOBTE_LOCUS21014 [Acanthoscelides obtectus]